MGRDSNFTCRTCKTNYYLGYGSYSSWHDGLTVEEFDALPEDDKNKDFYGNKNYRQCLEEHKGHNYKTWSYDWMSDTGDDGHLYLCGGGYDKDVVVIENYKDYKQIDLEPDWEVGE